MKRRRWPAIAVAVIMAGRCLTAVQADEWEIVALTMVAFYWSLSCALERHRG